MSSGPINISINNMNDPKFTYYIYSLKLCLRNFTQLLFEETSSDKYINIFSFNNNINFNDIIAYELNINIISFVSHSISIKNKFKIIDDSHVHKDNNVYIEFTKNTDNMTNCCIHLTGDRNTTFFTPPNY
jgi:hypothetical protein